MQWSDLRIFLEPFRLKFDVEDAALVANASDGVAVVRVSPGGVFDRLPFFLRLPLIATNQPLLAEDAPKEKPRRRPLQLPDLHVQQQRTRITLPPGFPPGELPKGQRVQFGPAVFVSEYHVDDQGAVNISYRFDTGDGRLTAKQVDELRAFLKKLASGGSPQEPGSRYFRFQQTATKLFEAGKFKRAFSEWQRLRRAYPKKALYEVQTAQALLAAGFGAAARPHARRAVQLEPNSALAHQWLGLTAIHDAFGRAYPGDFGRVAALDAFRKAVKLDPKNTEIRLNLITTLEHDRYGNQGSSEASMDDAITQIQALRKRIGQPDADMELRMALAFFLAGRFDEVEPVFKRARTLDVLAVRTAALAESKGSAAAMKQIVPLGIDDGQRRGALATACDYLVMRRRYPLAVKLLEAALDGLPPRSQPKLERSLALYRAIKRHDEPVAAKQKPEYVVKQLYVALAQGQSESQVAGLFTSKQETSSPDRGELSSVANEFRRRRYGMRAESVSAKGWLVDVASLLKFDVKGNDEDGYFVEAMLPGYRFSFWQVILEDGKYKLRDPGVGFSNLGADAIGLLEQGKPASARRLLDWPYSFEKSEVGWFDAFAGSPFARLWFDPTAEKNDDATRTAAAALMVRGPNAKAAIPILEATAKKAGRLRSLQIKRALAVAYVKVDPEKAITVTEELIARVPKVVTPYAIQGDALFQLGKLNMLDKLVARRLTKYPDDSWAQLAQGRVAMLRGDHDKAERQWRTMADTGHNFARALLAYNALHREHVPQSALADAKRAGNAAPSVPSRLLAAVYAEVDQGENARQHLIRRSELLGQSGLEGDDWYVWGRIAENHGLTDVAIGAYQKVEPPTRLFDFSYHTLAQRRLKALKATGQPKK